VEGSIHPQLQIQTFPLFKPAMAEAYRFGGAQAELQVSAVRCRGRLTWRGLYVPGMRQHWRTTHAV